ncbi:hypothetical protein BD770DRAFT_94029 [Pilaira anomala]|nr:hypothetical protein BD770DRAFT_94029 [Pilaira anomala]
MNSNSYRIPSDSPLKVDEYFKKKGSEAWSFSRFLNEFSRNSENPKSKKLFSKALHRYKVSIHAIINDPNTPGDLKRKLGRHLKSIRSNHQNQNMEERGITHINVEGSNNNITSFSNIKTLRLWDHVSLKNGASIYVHYNRIYSYCFFFRKRKCPVVLNH